MIAGPIGPPVRTLLIALALTVALWFIPYADALTYPLRLFATFIHQASHALAGFLVGFLAVQCVVDALFDLRTLLAISAPFAPGAHSDAAIMAQLTGIPAIFWALLWTGLALAMLAAALRAYAGERRVATALR